MMMRSQCQACSVGAHSVCTQGLAGGECFCATCHPPMNRECSVTELLYWLSFGAYSVRLSDDSLPEHVREQVFTAVRKQFDHAPIEEWLKVPAIVDAVLAPSRGEGNLGLYYSRSEVVERLSAAGLDVAKYKDVPYTPEDGSPLVSTTTTKLHLAASRAAQRE